MERIIILGCGGHGKSLADAIERQKQFEIAGFIINVEQEMDLTVDYPVLGQDGDLYRIFREGIHNAAVGVGYLGKGSVREKLYRQLKEIGFRLPVICDPSAVISCRTTIHEGTFVGKGAIINAAAEVGRMCIINTGSIVEHDCRIADFSHVAVGAVLCGNVQVGKASLIGANATVLQGRKVGNRCILGAGTTLKTDLKDGEIFR